MKSPTTIVAASVFSSVLAVAALQLLTGAITLGPATGRGPSRQASPDSVEALAAQVTRLQQELQVLRRELADARQASLLEAPQTPKAGSRPAVAAGDPAASGPAGVGGAPDASAAPRPVAEQVTQLGERLKELEQGEAAARTLRRQAVVDLEAGGRRRREAAELLGALARAGDKQAMEALLEAARHENPEVREEAIEGLGESGRAELLPALEQARNDKNPEVREEVAEALRSMPGEQAGPLLRGMLYDENPGVVREAVQSITRLGYADATGELRDLARHRNERVALEAAIALSRFGDRAAAEAWMPKLATRMKSESSRDRARALRAMREMGLESARTHYEQALKDESRRVRREAQRALRELGDR